jgi:hypothetical protein
MKQVSSLLLQLTTLYDRQRSTELFIAVGVDGGRPLSLHHTRRPSGHSLIGNHIDEQERVIAEQRVCNEEAARMKEQQVVEQRVHAEEAARMKEWQDVEIIVAEERSRNKEAARIKEQQEEKHVIEEQRVCNKDATWMKEQQEVEQRTRAKETASMKECVPRLVANAIYVPSLAGRLEFPSVGYQDIHNSVDILLRCSCSLHLAG